MRRLRNLRNLVGAAAVMGVVLVGVAVFAEPDERANRDPASPHVEPKPPTAAPGMRLVGLGRLAVEVPQDWVVAESGCARDTGVVFRYPDIVRKANELSPCDSFPVGQPWASWSQQLEVNDLRVSQSSFHHGPPEFCGPVPKKTRALRQSDLLFWSSAHDTFFQVVTGGHQAEETVLAIRHSIQVIPQGYASVPFIELGTSDAEAAAMLEQSGLEAGLPEVDWPHYVISTEPDAGSVVPVGSTVRLIPGDG